MFAVVCCTLVERAGFLLRWARLAERPRGRSSCWEPTIVAPYVQQLQQQQPRESKGPVCIGNPVSVLFLLFAYLSFFSVFFFFYSELIEEHALAFTDESRYVMSGPSNRFRFCIVMHQGVWGYYKCVSGDEEKNKLNRKCAHTEFCDFSTVNLIYPNIFYSNNYKVLKKRHLYVVIHRIRTFEVERLFFIRKFMIIKIVMITR